MTTPHRDALHFVAEPGSMLDFGRRLIAEAADVIDLPDATVEQLVEPDRVIEVTVPDPRPGGGVIRGFRSQHSSGLGPSKGGVRFASSVNRAEVEALSLFMTLKTATVGLPLGGGKGGIVADPNWFDEQQRAEVARAYARALADVIGPERDVLGPYVGTGDHEMDAVHEAWTEATGRSGSPATGKSEAAGGLAFRQGATARGLDQVFESFSELLGLGSSLRFAVHGFGSVGRNLAQRLVDRGHVLVAAGDSGGAVIDADGLDIDEIMARKREAGSVARGDTPSSAVLTAPCDLLIPAALQGVLDHSVAGEVEASLVLEGANAPCTWDGDAVLRERGVTVIPDILANAGGVAASFEEMTAPAERDDAETIAKRFDERVTGACAEVWNAADAHGVSLRTAAAVCALQRLTDA